MQRFILCLILLFPFKFANAGTQAHGGDAMRRLFELARSASIALVEDLKWCSFREDVPAGLVDYILANTPKIVADLEKSPTFWVVDVQKECAITTVNFSAGIYLSYPTCAQEVGNDLGKAIQKLLTLTGQHLGFDQNKSSQFARAIANQKVGSNCPLPTKDVFNPQICQTPPLTLADVLSHLGVAQSSTALGEYKTYIRSHRCNKYTGCIPWTMTADGTVVTPEGFKGGRIGYLQLSIAVNPDRYGWGLMIGYYQESRYIESTYIPISLSGSSSEPISIRNKEDGLTYAGHMGRDCGWFTTGVQQTPLDTYANYEEWEIVVYGTN